MSTNKVIIRLSVNHRCVIRNGAAQMGRWNFEWHGEGKIKVWREARGKVQTAVYLITNWVDGVTAEAVCIDTHTRTVTKGARSPLRYLQGGPIPLPAPMVV